MELEDFGDALRTYALSLPEAWEDHPWGESAIKVRKKVFLFNGFPNPDRYTLSVKLPESGLEAKLLPFCEPTGYGLGKSGWVTAKSAPASTFQRIRSSSRCASIAFGLSATPVTKRVAPPISEPPGSTPRFMPATTFVRPIESMSKTAVLSG